MSQAGILVALLWPPELRAQPQLCFEPTLRRFDAVIGRPATHDNQPAAIRTPTGDIEVWWCGSNLAFIGHDHIYRALLDADLNIIEDPEVVLAPSGSHTRSDGLHACAPTVIKHSHQGIYEGQELYYLYYECAPYVQNRSTGNWHGGFNQVCLAASFDGRAWMRYNAALWTSEGQFGDDDTDATPVVPFDPKVVENCDLQYSGGSYSGDLDLASCTDYYGSGHPSAVSVKFWPTGGRQIWLYHYDSKGDWAQHGYYLRKSWDGFHFDFEPPHDTGVTQFGNIKYFPELVLGAETGVFIGIGPAFNSSFFAYSSDGTTWSTPGPPWPPDPNQRLGRVRDDLCITPGPPSFVGDLYGAVSGASPIVLSSEGFRSSTEVPREESPPHDFMSPHPCYSSDEDQPYGRGTTWDLFAMDGEFRATTLGSDTDCAGCGDDCTSRFPHAGGSCVSQSCVLGECLGGWENCNGEPADGCETAVPTGQGCPNSDGGVSQVDASPLVDSSSLVDGSSPVDGSPPVDGSSPSDVSSPFDVSSPAEVRSPPPPGGGVAEGCACRASQPEPPLAIAMILTLLVLRRRRSSPRRALRRGI